MARQRDEEQVLMRVFFGEMDRCPSGPHKGKPLHEALLLTLKERGFQGGTVLRGVAGFGQGAQIHTGKILRLSMDLPVVLEVVDREDKVRAFLPELEKLLESGLVTLEKAWVLMYGPRTAEDG
jgi:PII-like signaling protein